VIVFGIEGGCFDLGAVLSEALEPALERLAQELPEELSRLGSGADDLAR
jgi:hypothetical protein